MVLVKGMNEPENFLLRQYPNLTRISSGQKPTELVILTPVGHNPDFRLFNPAEGKGIYVEVKGRPKNRMWYPMMERFPPWLKSIYKVVIVCRDEKDRALMKRRLNTIGIEWNEWTLDPKWVEQAARLYTGVDVLDMTEKLTVYGGVSADEH